MDKLLHIFGQGAPHDDVEIVGNREALEELRKTISEALHGVPYSMEASVNDGEGYEITVQLLEGDWDTPAWRKLAEPYTEEWARGNREDAISPQEIRKASNG